MVGRRLTELALAVAAAFFVLGVAVCGPASANEVVEACGSYPNNVFQPARATPVYVLGSDCLGGNTGTLSIVTSQGAISRGQAARWQANAPAGLGIVGASVPSPGLSANDINDGHQFGGGFYWQGGGVEITSNEASVGFGPIPLSPYMGFQIICGVPTCTDGAAMYVNGINVYVQETVGPHFAAPVGLWQSSGWVRGSWRMFASGDSPSGLCWLSASLNGQLINKTTASQDLSQWHQCAAPPIDQVINTARYGQGALPLTLNTADAAQVPASLTKRVYVDNQQPVVSLSGPTNAPSTAGTQYVRATASAGPSGVYGIACSVDGARARWYLARTASVPVSGVGEHQVRCLAENRATDAAGHRGQSGWTAFAMKIGEPTVSGITFGHMVNGPRCKRVKERVKVRGRWVTVRRGHRPVWVRRHGHTRTTMVTRCHPRTKMVRVAVRVRVHRHGKKVWITRRKRERVVLLPHVVHSTTLRVRHGRGAVVSGWLGEYTGVALAGQQVAVLSAPDNGLGQFTLAATATTAASGGWSAALAPGPSRLVEAVYYGGPTTEASMSGQVKLIVPARVKLLRVSPRRVPWGGTVRLVGQLVGGYLPPGGALVRLRIGFGSAFTTYGVHEHVSGNGRFTTTYTFGIGDARLHRSYWFQIASLPMGNYPYAPANSRRLSVVVGGHPTRPATTRGSPRRK
jgi:hypothetical protein